MTHIAYSATCCHLTKKPCPFIADRLKRFQEESPVRRAGSVTFPVVEKEGLEIESVWIYRDDDFSILWLDLFGDKCVEVCTDEHLVRIFKDGQIVVEMHERPQSPKENAPSEAEGASDKKVEGAEGEVKKCPKCQSTETSSTNCPCNTRFCWSCGEYFNIEGDEVTYSEQEGLNED